MTPVRIVLTLVLSLLSAMAQADLVVVVQAGSAVPQLERDEVTNIFLGRYRQMPGGQKALPVDLPVGDPDHARFYRLLVGKEPAQINAYWSRLIFSGRTLPPYQAVSAEAVAHFVATTAGGIGYLDRAQTDARLKIVFELER